MTLEQFEQVNARLREYFDPAQLPEFRRQPLLDGRFAIDCSYQEVMRLIGRGRKADRQTCLIDALLSGPRVR